MEAWHDLFIASAGAAAALMGLLFVGLSINLTKILSFPVLANRAMIASLLLLSILIQTLLLLVPHESPHFAGLCTLIIAVLAWPYRHHYFFPQGFTRCLGAVGGNQSVSRVFLRHSTGKPL